MPKLVRSWMVLVISIFISGVPAAFAQSSSAPQTQNQPQPNQPQQVEPPVLGQPTMPPINRNQLPENPEPAPVNPPNAAPRPMAAVQTQTPTEPTGTAAAEAEKPSGNAASRPAGAAIAPAKQHQVRSLLIKLGFIAGAGAALGTVYALSQASPGRVPNSPASTSR